MGRTLSLGCHYSQRYLFNAIPDINHKNDNPKIPNRNSKGNPNPTNPNTRYRCEYGTLNSTLAIYWNEASRTMWQAKIAFIHS